MEADLLSRPLLREMQDKTDENGFYKKD